ncbi:NADH:flavin oxidoreductase [Clostridium sp.]|uniref:NADH:flavin oxidoreductase n=1 Tax=Clostridium sp. TaxID=1506 RepID=UPI003D6D5ECD
MNNLLKSLKVGNIELNNRLVMAPMATSKSQDDGKVSEDILNYYKEKSEGGYISLIIIEHSFINKAGKASNGQLSVSNDNDIEGLKKLAKIVQSNGSKVVMQINHAGGAASSQVTGTKPVAPSAISNTRFKESELPHELSKDEIKAIIKNFGRAASLVKEANFDGVEIHSAHGYLLNQFFSPLSNKRTDEYGGDVNNRIRIHLEVIKEVKQAVGEDFLVLLRLGAADYTEGGTVIEDSVIAAKEFEKAGVHILDISGGFNGYTMPSSTEQGYFWPLTDAIKKAVSIPVILTGGITEASAAERLLSEGKTDLIGVGRAILKDSKWAQRAIEKLK